MARTKKVKASGRMKSGYGTNNRIRFVAVESRQRKKQKSPYHPNSRAKRISSGIWKCVKTGRVFAGKSYYLDEQLKKRVKHQE